MRKNVFIFGIIIFTLVLVGCNPQEEKSEENEGPDENVNESEVEDLTEDEIYQIAANTYSNLEEIMEDVQTEHDGEWKGAAYIDTFDMENEQTQLAYDIVSEALEDYFTADHLKAEKDGTVHLFLLQYFSYLIKILPYHEEVLHHAFDVVEQDEAHFIIESMELEDEAGYTVSGWSKVEFVKVDEKWKIHEYTYTSPEERPFDLTYIDLNCVETDAEIEAETPCVLIDMTEKDGESFIVYEDLIYGDQDSRNIIARNTANSEFDFEIAESYR